jgi:hypothetical protein
VSVVIYALTILAIVLGSGLMRFHVERARLLKPDAQLDSWYRYTVAPVVFLISIPLALFVSPAVAEYSWLLLLLTGPVERRLGQRTS